MPPPFLKEEEGLFAPVCVIYSGCLATSLGDSDRAQPIPPHPNGVPPTRTPLNVSPGALSSPDRVLQRRWLPCPPPSCDTITITISRSPYLKRLLLQCYSSTYLGMLELVWNITPAGSAVGDSITEDHSRLAVNLRRGCRNEISGCLIDLHHFCVHSREQ